MKVKHHILYIVLAFILGGFVFARLYAANGTVERLAIPIKVALANPICPPDTNPPVLPQPDINPLAPDPDNPFFLRNPQGVGQSIIYDPTTNTYNFQYMTGSTPFGPSSYMDIKEYIDYDLQQSIHDYWQNQSRSLGAKGNSRTGSGLIPQLHIGGDIFEGIFGSNTIDIRPSGSVGLKLGAKYTQNDNWNLPVKQRRHLALDFDEDIQLNLLAKIGDKIEFNLNYSTDELSVSTKTDQIKLKYNGKEDDILQLIEFGDITFPLNSTLITGSQSLFGVKTQLKFGNLFVTAVASRKKGSTQTITVSGGAEETDFYFRADEYEENKHFFLGQFFEEHYNQYLSTLPLVSSPIVITKIEVWRTTVGAATTNNRNIVAFTDLGEYDPQFYNISYNPAYPGGQYPDNNINTLPMYADSSLIRNISTVSSNLQSLGMKSGTDYEKVESARLLSPNEYTVNTKLGFISLNSALASDQVLAVAFQYTIIGDDKVYQVGEFSNEVSTPNCIRVKMLKSSNLNTKSPLWKLMMKNVYSLSAYQVSSDKFRLNILYTGDAEGTPNGFFTQGAQKGIPLIRLMGLDRLNKQQDPTPDGIFDFIDGAQISGGTINSANGRIYFPTTQPFGKDLRAVIDEPELADKYAFDSLYTMTKTMAQQITNKNKYYIEGSYRSSYGSEFHFTGGGATKSVKVTAGGVTLTENVDYTVNYDMGVVTIINQSILASGTPIQITPEVDDAYQTDKRMFGVNLDYVFSPDFTVGATLLNLRERPITNKVNYGDEPINNLIWGMNFAYKTELPFITKAIDLLSFHHTTTKSFLNLDGEFAHFIPGHNRQIGKSGTTYIDNFESAKSTIDLMNISNWVMASTPQGQPDLFPEAMPVPVTAPERRQLAYGFNRARMAWYIIDPMFYNSGSAVPSNITAEDLSYPYARAVYETELFPYKERPTSLSTQMTVFNMAFYPSERGANNYDVDGSEGYSRGLNEDGTLRDPETRWGGIMRKFDQTDFESSNYEYIEFWMMDPFINNPDHKGGKLYFNLGDISEDILRDGHKFYENGMPTDDSDTDVDFTVWGRVPTKQQIINSFDNQAGTRIYQDIGYDGLSTEREIEYFDETYISRVAAAFGTGSQAYQMAVTDPSADNYHYFRGSDYDAADVKIVERYKYFNNAEGNSPDENNSIENYPTAATNLPNMEDMNNDNTLSEDERYYQYVIDLSPEKMVVGENYINDIYDAHPDRLPNGERPVTRWYQFRIPIHNPDKVVNNMTGFNSIRFMRVFMRDFEEPIVCRLATFELVRSSWRTYNLSLREDGDYLPTQDDGESSFYVGTVSYEENANRIPIPYMLPPGIVRETAYGMTATSYEENEQSVTLKAVDLPDGDSRAIYKNTSYDLRQFNNLQMYIHAEDVFSSGDLKPGDVTAFIRLGSDFTENFYEYEIPIEITPWGVGRDTNAIWPEKNRIFIVLDSLVSLKMQRNREVRQGTHPSILVPYTSLQYDEDEPRMRVVGNPNLGEVTTIMIGVRNPKKRSLNDHDDMQPKSVEMWINELRLSGFDDRQGVAALLRARTTLADVGDITISGTYSTPGFGALEQSITQRSHETNINFDLATNIDGGKLLFPENWHIKVPVHYDYSLGVVQPEYNPLNPDVKMKDDLADLPTAEARDSLRYLTNKVTRRQNVNLMNVRKERDFSKGNTKMHIWDVENLDFSYSYSELVQRDEDMEMNNEYIHNGEIGYTFSTNPKNYKPFSRAKWTKSKWLQLIRDFNITPMPKNITFRTTLHRDMQQFKYRPKSKGNIIVDTNYVKSFDWTRNYAFNWDIFQSLKLEFRADASARIDEPDGLIDTREKKDSIWHCLGRGGRTTDYRQTFNATYQVPINKIPLFKFVNANVRYTSMYSYTASALSLSYLGNTIQNSQNLQGTASLNFITLYNSVPYLKKVNQGISRNNKNTNKKDNSRDSKDKTAEELEKGKNKKDKNDSLKEKSEIGRMILDGTVRVLMSLRNVSATFSQGRGTTLPGYMYSATLVGITKESSGPGFLFMFGGQPDIQTIAARNKWLTTDSMMNSPYLRTKNQVLTFRATVEPFRDFRIEVSANRNFTENFSEYFHVDEMGNVSHYTPQRSGAFSMTYCALGTFFKNHDDLFETFRDVRLELAQRYAQNNPNYNGETDPETGFPEGYSEISQDVLMGAFMTTYLSIDKEKGNIFSPFLKIPLPNWRLNYNGLTKIKGMNKVFQSFSITHNYTCNYNIGSYSTNIAYRQDENGYPNAYNALGDFIPTNELSQMALTEQFSPLIGFDMTLKNSMLLKVEYKQSRNISLSFANTQITETRAKEVTVSAGYRFKDIKLGLVFAGVKRQFVSDLNLTAGFGLKDNETMLRRITENDQQVTSGALNVTINLAADYQFSRMVGIKFYYDQAINKPKNQNQYNNMNFETGIQLQLMLSQ